MDKKTQEHVRKVGLSLAAAAKRNDEAAVAKWATKALVEVLPEPEPEPVVDLAEVPNFGESKAMSGALYGDWVAAWWAKNFGELASVDYPVIAEQATADGCLAQVCAVGKLGSPDGPVPDLGDWSLYTAYTMAMDENGLTNRVYHMGKLVGEQVGGNGLEFAKSLGFDW